LAIGSESGTYPIQFGINNRILASILANGNVGIGTTSPLNLLHVNTPTTQIALRVSQSNSSRYLALNAYSVFTTGDDFQCGSDVGVIQLFTNSTARQTILNNGNVGIGTTSPGYPLDVRGYINASNGGGTANVYMGVSGEGAIIYENNAGGISINSNDGAVSLNSDTGASLTVDSAGTSNVTIGTYITFSGNAGFGGTYTPSFPIDCGGIINTKSLLFGNGVSTLKISNAFSQSGHGTTIDLNNSLAYLIAPSAPAQVFSFTNIPGNATAVNLYFLINTSTSYTAVFNLASGGTFILTPSESAIFMAYNSIMWPVQ